MKIVEASYFVTSISQTGMIYIRERPRKRHYHSVSGCFKLKLADAFPLLLDKRSSFYFCRDYAVPVWPL